MQTYLSYSNRFFFPQNSIERNKIKVQRNFCKWCTYKSILFFKRVVSWIFSTLDIFPQPLPSCVNFYSFDESYGFQGSSLTNLKCEDHVRISKQISTFDEKWVYMNIHLKTISFKGLVYLKTWWKLSQFPDVHPAAPTLFSQKDVRRK